MNLFLVQASIVKVLRRESGNTVCLEVRRGGGSEHFSSTSVQGKKNSTWRLRRLEPLSGSSPDCKSSTMTTTPSGTTNMRADVLAFDENKEARRFSVSYTHLTLPTNREV